MANIPPRVAVKMGLGAEAWTVAAIACLSACASVLFVAVPSVFVSCLFAFLMVTAFVRPGFCVYVSIFLLPWHPEVTVGVPVRDVSLLLHFALFIGIAVQLRGRDKSIREWLWGNRIKKAILLFAGAASFSFVRSSLPLTFDSIRPLILLISYIAFYFVIDGWLETRSQFVRVLELLLISTILVDLFGFYQAIEGGYTAVYTTLYPTDELLPWTGRITSLIQGFNSLAGYLNLVIPLAIACAALGKEYRLRALGITCALASAMALYLTQSRGGLIALIGILLLAIWFLVPRLSTRLKLLGGIAVAGALFVTALMAYFPRMQNIAEDPDAMTRLPLWAAAVAIFAAHPVLGAGYGSFRFLVADFPFVPNPVEGRLDAHNIYLQFLAETGVVGFAAFVAFVGLFISLALRSVRGQDPLARIAAFGVIGAIGSTLIHGMVDFLFRVCPQFGILFWIILGLGSSVLTATSVKVAANSADYERQRRFS